MSSSQPSPRYDFFSVGTHSSVYLWGGRVDVGVPVDDLDYLHEFNSATATWTRHQLQGRHPPGLYNGGCARIDDCLYFYGGYDESMYFDGAWDTRAEKTGSLYRLNLTNWTLQEVSPPEASGSPGVKSGCSVIDYKSSLLVHGGWDEHGRLLNNDLHMFDLSTGEFKLS